MAHSSPMDQPRTGGSEYLTAAEVRELVRSEIKVGQRPSSSTWIAAIASLTLILGFMQWQVTGLRDDMRTEFGGVQAELQGVRDKMGDEIGSLRADVGALRGEVSSLDERAARLEALLVDRLPAAP